MSSRRRKPEEPHQDEEDGQCLSDRALYHITSKIAEGSGGNVWLGVHRDTHESVAIKLLPRGTKCGKYAKRELKALVFDYCDCGNVQQYISKTGPLPEAEARHFFQQLIIAVSYMHDMGIVNRDIKAENALLCSNGRLKLADFGFAKSDSDSHPKSSVGTPNYAAPEVVAPILDADGWAAEAELYDGAAADAWSCGVFLYACLFSRYPFQRPDDPVDQRGVAQVFLRTLACDYVIPNDPPISAKARHLIQSLLVKDPEARMTIAQVMTHPFFLTNLPEGALTLNERCREMQLQIPIEELVWREQWVSSLWELAKSPGSRDASTATSTAAIKSRKGINVDRAPTTWS